eukprot:1903572-Pyramimonas_sp.AAC.1
MENRSSRWATRRSPRPANSSRTGSARCAHMQGKANTWAPGGSCWRPRQSPSRKPSARQGL